MDVSEILGVGIPDNNSIYHRTRHGRDNLLLGIAWQILHVKCFSRSRPYREKMQNILYPYFLEHKKCGIYSSIFLFIEFSLSVSLNV